MCRFLIEEGADVDFAEAKLDWSRLEAEENTILKVDCDPDLDISRRVKFNPIFKASRESIAYSGPLDVRHGNLCEGDIVYQGASNRCHKYLLEANADPTMEVSSYWGYHIEYVLHSGTAVRSVRSTPRQYY